MYRDPVIAEAYAQADSGKAFVQALAAKNYRLAQGRSRLVVIDPYGQAHNPVRHVEGLRTKQFTERLSDVDLTALPDASDLSKAVMLKNRQRYEESLRHDQAAARKRLQLEERQRIERAACDRLTAAQMERERLALERTHRVAEQEKEIARLRQQTQNSKWWQDLLGLTKRARRTLEEREATRDNAQWRIQEKMGQLEGEKQRALANMAARHAQEKQRAEREAETGRPTGYAAHVERAKMRQAFEAERGGRGSREQSGPELER